MAKWTTERARALSGLALVAIVGVALWLHWPSLHSGLAADDFLQRAMLDGAYPIARSPLDLYSFKRHASEAATLIDSGILPWWSPPELRLSMLRPLSSLLLSLDYRAFGSFVPGAHGHSFLWLVLFVASFHLYASRVVPRGAALAATALMAFDLSLAAPVGWLCARTALVSATFGTLGLWAYHRLREEGWRPGRYVALGAFSLSLAAGEYAICALAFVLAFELVAARDAPRERLRASLWAFAPAAVYASIHVALGYGAGGSFVYVGPFDSPLTFAKGAVLRVPALLTGELTLAPAEWVYFGFLLRAPVTFLAFVPLLPIAALFVAAVRRADPALRRRLFAWMLGVFLGLVPLAGTLPASRLLLVPSIGGSLVLGTTIWSGLARLSDSEERRRVVSWLVALGVLPLLVLHAVVSPMIAHFHAELWRDAVAQLRRSYDEAPLDDARVAGQDVFLLSVPNDLIPLMFPPWVRRADGHPLPRRWRVLASAVYPQKLVRMADDTLDLVVLEPGAMFGGPLSPFAESERRMPVGFQTRLSGCEIRVLELRGGAPSRVRYRFDGSVDDPSRVFLKLERGQLTRVSLPAIGGEVEIPEK